MRHLVTWYAACYVIEYVQHNESMYPKVVFMENKIIKSNEAFRAQLHSSMFEYIRKKANSVPQKHHRHITDEKTQHISDETTHRN